MDSSGFRPHVAGVIEAIRRILIGFAACAALSAAGSGRVEDRNFPSTALAEAIHYRVYLPAGYSGDGGTRYPTLYLLHGRGDKMTAWSNIIPDLDRLIAAGKIPPVIAIMPDATASKRAGYYIDSEFKGTDGLPAGLAVETALTRDLIAHVDATYSTQNNRLGRVVAGYSMGGYGAVRYLLVHPELFAAGVALSPAVYVPTSPADSSTRQFGAFGRGTAIFDEAIYRAKNYPEQIAGFEKRGLPVFLYIGVGDDESAIPPPASSTHDLDYEAHTLYNRMRRVKGVTTELRVVNGRHDWDAWQPTFVEGVELALRHVSRMRAAPQ